MDPYSKKINGNLCVSSGFLVGNGFNMATLNNHFTKYKKGSAVTYSFHKDPVTGTKWVVYESIPPKALSRLKLPEKPEELQKILENSIPEVQEPALSSTTRDFQRCWYVGNWIHFYPEYEGYMLSRHVRTLFAKTHYIIAYIIRLKRHETFPLKELYQSYMRLPNAVFKTKSYKYFSAKIKKCEVNGIAETLVHGFRIYGRKPYKVTPEVKKLIRNYMYSPMRHSTTKIYRMVNQELACKKLPGVSESTVRRICSDRELVNRSMHLRYGTAYAENNLLPFMDRKEVENVGDLYVIDSTRLNFPYFTDGKTNYLWLCAMIDACSRKIVGYSFGNSENLQMINECLKSAFSTNPLRPRQILCDNHGSFRNIEFLTLESKLIDYGVQIRRARKRNPRDKGHVESWFATLQEKYLSARMGFLGEGIKTKRKDGRVGPEMERLILSKDWSVSKDQVMKWVSADIHSYNEEFHQTMKGVPSIIYRAETKNAIRAFHRNDISLLFGRSKKIKVKNGKIRFMHLKRRYTYQIWNTETINRLNGTTVTVRFHEPDLSEIEVFDKDDLHQCSVKMEVRYSPVPQNNEESKVFQDFHLKKIGVIRENLENIYDDLVPIGEEAIALPNLSLDEGLIKKMNAVKNLDRALMEKTFSEYGISDGNPLPLNYQNRGTKGNFIFYRPERTKLLNFKRISNGSPTAKKEI